MKTQDAPGGFSEWALDPERTVEEKYGALLLIEVTAREADHKQTGIWPEVPFSYGPTNRRERQQDPGYVPSFEPEHARWAEAVLPEVKSIAIFHSSDRPLRDISMLRFCPALESLEVTGSEVRDWAPLRYLRGLKSLRILDHQCRDLRCLARLPQLESLSLTLMQPWPDLRGLERLTQLKNLSFNGNLLVLRDIPRLASLREASFDGHNFRLPLPKVADLPAMPILRKMKLNSVCDLEGIERYLHLLNLEIHGGYQDLSPLARLSELTHLLLGCQETPDVAELNRLASLRRVTFQLEFPPDLTPLAEAPRLHEIKLKGTPIIPAELDSLNSLFESWDEEFRLPRPRTLQPLGMRIQQSPETRWGESPAEPRDWGSDDEMNRSEGEWFTRAVNRSLDQLLGKGWGHVDSYGSTGCIQIPIERAEDIDRMPAIAQAMRQLIAAARHPWSCHFIIDNLARYERPLEEIQGEADEDEFDAEFWLQETRDWHQKEKDRRNFLKRKYLHQLSQESGVPPPPLEIPEEPEEEEDEGSFFAEQPEYDLGTQLRFHAMLNESHVYVWASVRELAEMIFELKAEE